jgi:hypothetical protein
LSYYFSSKNFPYCCNIGFTKLLAIFLMNRDKSIGRSD